MDKRSGFSFKLKSKISAPSAPKQYGWVDVIEKGNEEKGPKNLNKDGKVIEKLKKKKERTQTALSIDTTEDTLETIDDREDDSKAVSRGTIHFKTQFITDGDIMIDEKDEKQVKLEKVKFDENPIEFYEIGLEVEEFEKNFQVLNILNANNHLNFKERNMSYIVIERNGLVTGLFVLLMLEVVLTLATIIIFCCFEYRASKKKSLKTTTTTTELKH
ncbi:unnamed protein product [Caenorhabditis nigoni]